MTDLVLIAAENIQHALWQFAQQRKKPVIMHERIKEQSDLAHFYAQDGAYHSAARVLTDLAAEVAAHAKRNTELMEQGGGDVKTRALMNR